MKKNEIFTYIYFAIISLCKSLNLTNGSKVYVCLYIFGTIFIFFKIFNEKYTISELIKIVSLVVLCASIAYFGKNLTPLYFAISIISLKKVSIKKVIKIIFFTKLFGFLLLFILSSLGIIENNAYMMYRDIIGQTSRYSFGYLHPNITHMHFLVIIFMFYYIFHERTNIITDFIVLILNYSLYCFTVSRTSFILCCIFIFYYIVLRFNDKFKNIILFFAKYSYFIFFGISLLLAYLWDKMKFIRYVDSLLTGRIYYNYVLLHDFTIPLIGGNHFTNYINFDNGYFALLYQCGLLFTIYLSISMWKLVKKYFVEQKYNELIFIFFMNLLGFTENIIYTPVINFTIIFIADVFFIEYAEKSASKKEKGIE